MSRKQRKRLIRIIVSFVLLIAVSLMGFEGWLKYVAFLVSYTVIGWDVLCRAVRNILHGQVFDENFLMTIATIGAFALEEYKEAVAVMIFYQVGELFENIAVSN